MAGSNPAILFSVNTAQPATVSLPLFRSCGSCASGGGLCRNSPDCSFPIRRNSGTWFSYGDQRIGQGRENTRKFLKENAEIADAVARIEEGLEGRGRVLLRYSGTEPLCRVMVEGQDADKVRVYANELAGIVEKALG